MSAANERKPPKKLEDLEVVLTEESQEDILLKCKMAILDLTDELERERRKVGELERQREGYEKVKLRNEMLESQRKEYMKENALLRYFIANLESKPKAGQQPIDVLLAAHKQKVIPQRTPAFDVMASVKKPSAISTKSPSPVQREAAGTDCKSQSSTAAKASPVDSRPHRATVSSIRKYRYLL